MKFNTMQHVLQNIRTRHNLTQADFAEKIFVSRQTVSNWERSISTPPVTALTIIANTFDMPLTELMTALEGEQPDNNHTAERQLIVDAFLSLLQQHNGTYCDMAQIIQESVIAYHRAMTLFDSPSAILQYIAKQLDAQVIAALDTNTVGDPFEMIADYVLPVLYDNSHTLKILYSGHYANGEWLYFLKNAYIKWATPFFDNYDLKTAPISRKFAVELTVKTTSNYIHLAHTANPQRPTSISTNILTSHTNTDHTTHFTITARLGLFLCKQH
ncbi:helix-turn-helix domain-containing protein [Leuconostoc miyukkimchii]|uniref:helix-turn-helix domain-containing protein n=1 Tax=Leuconostoc miyukkimchii TaxID=910540 RepID=UPI001FE8D0D7|nr:helix-turn-helix transcriptional regulator [Leuconostoc miyukkimchii]